MYRHSHDSLAEKVRCLEQELREVRAFRPPGPRERILVVVTAFSVVVALSSFVGLRSVKRHASDFQQRFSPRLEAQTRALGECESFGLQEKNALQQCRIDLAYARWATEEGVTNAPRPAEMASAMDRSTAENQ